jgi:hypothetical protein
LNLILLHQRMKYTSEVVLLKHSVYDEVNGYSHSDLYKMFISKDAIMPA